MVSSALVLVDDSQYMLLAKLAKVAAGSNYTKQTEVQSMFIMLRGLELGISPMQALDGIQVIQGKTTVSPQLMLALINRSGQLADLKIEDDGQACHVTMTRVGRSAHTESFSMKDAALMKSKEDGKMVSLSEKFNWRSMPAVMRKWRAVSACARIVFPDVIQGMYTPEEMGAEVSENSSGDLVIETPASVIPADFTKTEEAVARLAATNVEVEAEYVQVDENGEIVLPDQSGDKIVPISNEKALNSDLPPENEETLVTPQIAAATAKANLAGNGAPANGEKKVIGRWAFDRNALLTALSPWTKDVSYQERNATVKKMDDEKAFANCATLAEAVQLVVARLNSPEHGKAKKEPAKPASTWDKNGVEQDGETADSMEF